MNNEQIASLEARVRKLELATPPIGSALFSLLLFWLFMMWMFNGLRFDGGVCWKYTKSDPWTCIATEQRK